MPRGGGVGTGRGGAVCQNGKRGWGAGWPRGGGGGGVRQSPLHVCSCVAMSQGHMQRHRPAWNPSPPLPSHPVAPQIPRLLHPHAAAAISPPTHPPPALTATPVVEILAVNPARRRRQRAARGQPRAPRQRRAAGRVGRDREAVRGRDGRSRNAVPGPRPGCRVRQPAAAEPRRARRAVHAGRVPRMT